MLNDFEKEETGNKKSVLAKLLIFIFIFLLIIVAIGGYLVIEQYIVTGDKEEVLGDVELQLEDPEVTLFNSEFLVYEESDIDYLELQLLMEAVISSNNENEEYVIKVISENEVIENYEKYIARFLEDELYSVEFSYDETGRISSINITGTLVEIDEEQEAFNNRILEYQREYVTGVELNELVDIVIELNNDAENEHKIGVQIIVKDSDTLGFSFEEMLDRTNIGYASEEKVYAITTSEDIAIGYINVVTIEELGDEVDILNREYEKYNETDVNGTKLNELLEKVAQDNAGNSELNIVVKMVSLEGKSFEYENFIDIDVVGKAAETNQYQILVHKEETYISQIEVIEISENTTSNLTQSIFNSAFTEYEGTGVKGDVVNELIDKVIENNLDETEERKIKVTINTAQGTVVSVSSADAISTEQIGVAPSTKKYDIEVKIGIYSNNVEEVVISEN